MNILIDTNVILDWLLQRGEHAPTANTLVARVETQHVMGFVGATTVTTVFYLCQKQLDLKAARLCVRQLLTLFDVAPVGRVIIEDALNSTMPDFEDAVLTEAARRVAAHAIVTRNIRDFQRSSVPAYTPREFLVLVDQLGHSD